MLRLIGAFKLAKGIVLAIAGLAVLRLMHRDVAEVATAWAFKLHLDPGRRFISAMLENLGAVSPRTLAAVTAGMFLYAALFTTEGVGLLLRKRWAEYFTMIVTGCFIPLEVFELTRRATPLRLAVTVANVAIVWYLVTRRAQRAGARVGR